MRECLSRRIEGRCQIQLELRHPPHCLGHFTPAAVLWFSRLRSLTAPSSKRPQLLATRARRGEYDDEAYEEVGADYLSTGDSINTSSSWSQKPAMPSPHAPLQDQQLALNEATIRCLEGLSMVELLQKIPPPVLKSVCHGSQDVVLLSPPTQTRTLLGLLAAVERAAALKGAVRRGRVIAIIVLPGREAAQQLHAAAYTLLMHHNLTVQLVTGGVPVKQEIAAMRARCPDVLVATPNKLLFLLGCERVKLQPLFDDVRLLVIDSADVQAAPEFRSTTEGIARAVQSMAPNSASAATKVQSILLTAAASVAVRALARATLQPGYQLMALPVGQSSPPPQRTTHAAPAVTPLAQYKDPVDFTDLTYQQRRQQPHQQNQEQDATSHTDLPSTSEDARLHVTRGKGGSSTGSKSSSIGSSGGMAAVIPESNLLAARSGIDSHVVDDSSSSSGNGSSGNTSSSSVWSDVTQGDWLGAEAASSQQIQQVLVTPLAHQLGNVYLLLRQHLMSVQHHKVVVVLPTAGLVIFYAALFQAMGIPALELHSRKSHIHRTQVLQGFCASSRAVVFSTDVCARGVSLPGLTLLLQTRVLRKQPAYHAQVGLPQDKQSYLQRMLLITESSPALQNLFGGATAALPPQPTIQPKADAILLLCQHESEAASQMLGGLPLTRYSSAGMEGEQAVVRASERVMQALWKVPAKVKCHAYATLLSYTLRHPMLSHTVLGQAAVRRKQLLGSSGSSMPSAGSSLEGLNSSAGAARAFASFVGLPAPPRMAPHRALAMGLPKAAGLVMTRFYPRKCLPVERRPSVLQSLPVDGPRDRYSYLTAAAKHAGVLAMQFHEVKLSKRARSYQKNSRRLERKSLRLQLQASDDGSRLFTEPGSLASS